jgi:cell division septation protein DedD
VNNVVGTLVQLSLEDVQKEGEVNFPDHSGVGVVLETFDGLRLHVHTAKQDDKMFGKFSAEYDPNLVQPVNVSSSSEKGEKNQTAASAQVEKTSESNDGNQPAAPDSTPSPKEDAVLKKPEEVQMEVEAFNQRVQGWTYELPIFRVENFSKSKKDLIAKIP